MTEKKEKKSEEEDFFSDIEQEKVKERLKKLGYLE